MAVKKRVFQVAREFSISNEALVDFLKEQGFDVRNHMSPLSDDALAKAQDKFSHEPVVETADEETDFRKKVRDHSHSDEKGASEKAKEELALRMKIAQEIVQERPKIRQEKQEQLEREEKARIEAEEKAKAEAEALKAAQPKPEKIELPKRRPKKKLKIVEIPVDEKERAAQQQKSQEAKSGDKAKTDQGDAKTRSDKSVKKDKGSGQKHEKEDSPSKKRRRRGKSQPDVEVEIDTEELDVTISPKDSVKAGVSKKKKKKRKKPSFDEGEIQASIKATMASMDDSGKGKKRRRKVQTETGEEIEETSVIRVSEFMSLSELAKLMEVDGTELVRKCMELGMMVSINQRLEMETIELLADEYGFEVEALQEFGEDQLEEIDEELEDEENLQSRPPVVTIMGHVDHGKTSLLDYIRETNVVAGESGGITQHIGAYEVDLNGKQITFLDTPGHEAFTAMRARGAQATDIVILVVAADDNVMPQTEEAISHAKAAGVPIVVAVNKIDKPSANPENVKKQLANRDVLIEEWGGKYQYAEVSAKTGQNIDHLLELILLEAEMLDLRANPDRKARGVVVEAQLDKGKGVVATVLVQTGTLRVGDPFVAGTFSGKVRNLLDERGKRVDKAGPSCPVQILGFGGMPQAGDKLVVLDSEKETREISQKRQQLQREHEHWQSRPRTLDEISQQIQKGAIKQLSVVIKADVDGSIEAIIDSLMKLSTNEVAVEVIHKGVGAITESDVLLASASGAIIVGFHVRPTSKARELAAKEHVDIRSYDVIYDILDDVKAALEGFLSPTISEQVVGTIEVRETFKVPKIGVIAGCYVQNGKVNRKNRVKLYRDDRLIHDGKLSSLKRFKDDAKEVASGFECGLGLEGYQDIKVNDIIEVYEIVETKRTLDD